MLAAVLAFLPGRLSSQVDMNMPYSIYGIGEPRFNQYFQNMGMGGINQAYQSNVSINDVNPASYAALDSTSFVFEATLFSHFYEQETPDIRQQSDHVSLGNLSIGFPVTRWFSFAAGLKPYSQVGYRVSDAQNDDIVGQVNYRYRGSGGLNQFFMGGALEFIDGLSVGANVSYLFGNLDYEAMITSDSADLFHINFTNANNVSGWMYDFGIQYHHIFSDYQYLTIGATYGQQQDANVSTTELFLRRMPGAIRYDTIARYELDDDILTLPAHYGFGVYGRLSQQWAAGIDYQWQNWNAFEFRGKPEDFNDSWQMAAGLRFNPGGGAFANLFQRLEYSAGFRYGQTYLKPDGKDLEEFGISFGTRIPIRGSLSALRVSFEYSQRGSTTDHLMQENFYRVNVGLNIYERWFIRRRFF